MGKGVIRHQDLHDNLQKELYRPNLLVNGDFRVSNRGDVIQATPGVVTAFDKWYSYTTGSPRFTRLPYHVLWECTGNDNLGQMIAPTKRLAQHRLILSLYMLIPNGKSVTLSVKDAPNNTALGTTVEEKAVVGDGSWKVYTMNVPARDYVDFLRVNIACYVQCEISISYVKLEIGDFSTPFIPRAYNEELLDCVESLDYRPNLLINGDFRINQRAQSSYSPVYGGAYMIDRWTNSFSVASAGKFDVVSNGVQITPLISGSSIGLSQIFEDGYLLKGKLVTLSASIDGVVYSSTFTMPDNTGQSITINDVQLLVQTISSNKTGKIVVSLINLASTKTINWIKLELNDHATPFISRSYAEELRDCQRYYETLTTSIWGGS